MAARCRAEQFVVSALDDRVVSLPLALRGNRPGGLSFPGSGLRMVDLVGLAAPDDFAFMDAGHLGKPFAIAELSCPDQGRHGIAVPSTGIVAGQTGAVLSPQRKPPDLTFGDFGVKFEGTVA